MAGVARGEVEQDRSLNSAGIQFKAFAHEREEFVPVGELDIAQQRFNVLEEFLASAQGLADQAILFIYQVKNGVEKEGQQVQAE